MNHHDNRAEERNNIMLCAHLLCTYMHQQTLPHKLKLFSIRVDTTSDGNSSEIMEGEEEK